MLKSTFNDQSFAFAELPKVKLFLDSIGRNSKKSKRTYFTGLRHLHNFITQKYTQFDCESILEQLANGSINVYEMLDSFVSYILQERNGITAKSVSLYVTAIRSYLAYYDIDVLPSKFKRKVKMPKRYREDEEPIDASDIRKILLGCNNRRLKTVLLFLASGAMRATGCLAIRNMDIDFTVSPTKIRLRKEYSKTKVGRDVYISDEATEYLKHWLDWKYKNPERKREFNKNDLVFTITKASNPVSIYTKVWEEFDKLLKVVKMDERKEQGIANRKKITIHSLRRFCKTVISEQARQDYSEFFLGHAKSPYWTMKEAKRREIYATKVMKYLTFLDYSVLETTGKNIEAKLNEKEMEIQYLRQRDLKHETEMIQMQNQLDKIVSLIQENPKLAKVKTQVLSEI
jgi:integrase